jgi:hypothetical protein
VAGELTARGPLLAGEIVELLHVFMKPSEAVKQVKTFKKPPESTVLE